MTTLTLDHRVWVNPRTRKARNRFANEMGKDPILTVEQETSTHFFCVSSNRQYCAWILKNNDPDWVVIQFCKEVS
ncbi:MAG: hypothetical protein VXX91_08285 [Planctomycetota bacterium]|nr:hypothetical protein [Planctomycetota bacterium]